MIRLVKKTAEKKEQATLTLPYASRAKSRLRAALDDGRDVGLLLERGQVLKHGDLLASEDGMVVKIIAANEKVSTVVCRDSLMMAKACYHLGNRHVPLQIDDQRLQYLHDHVLDDMLVGLGLDVHIQHVPFEPEDGAYGGGHHHHH